MKKISQDKNRVKKISVFSKKLGKVITIATSPQNLPRELYECAGMSNGDYGS